MVEISAIASALASFKAAKDIAQAMIGLRDSAAFQEKMIEFQSKILDAQNAAFAANEERTALVDRIRELEEKMAKMKAWEAEKQRYELKAVYTGAFAYVPKAEMQETEPRHWLCTTCFQNGKKSLLQAHGRTPRDHSFEIYKCFQCNEAIRVHYSRNPTKVE